MADISQIKLLNGNTYNLKDATARNNKVDKAGDTMTGNLVVPAIRSANTYYGISFGRTTSTPIETILYTGIKWASSSHMPVVHITGYAYGLQSPVEFKIGFYIYDGKIGWSGVTNMGSWNPVVYLFKYARQSIDYVAIGLSGSCYYLQLSADVQDEMGKFASIVADSSAWSWSFLTSAGTIPAADGGTTCVQVPYKADILNPTKVNDHTVNSDVPANAVFTDTKNTAGSTDTSSKIFLIGATSQAANPQTYSHDTAYVGTDGCLYSGGTKVLTAHQSLSGKLDTSLKGAANGLAELDENGKVPTAQLPSYVDDVLEYTAKSSFPATGETGKIYVDTGTNKTYRWSGSAYVEISASLALGTTSSTAFRGDYGNSAYAHAVTNKGSAFASGLYKITTNSEGHVTAATAVVKADITGLGIPGSDTNTHRPIQVNGTQVLGDNTTALNLKAGSNVSVTNSSGTVTIAATDTTYSSKAAASGGTDVSLVTTGEKYTWNNKGTYSKPSGGIPKTDLASAVQTSLEKADSALQSHQDISGKADKSSTVSTVAWDSTNKKITKTINGSASDVVSAATILGNLTSSQVTAALGYTPSSTDTNTHRPIQVNGTQVLGDNTTALNLKAGANVSLTNSSGTVTIAATDTTYSVATTSSNGLMSSADKTIINSLKNLSTLEYEVVS